MQETVRKHGRKEGDHERPIYASGSAHSLWFERVTSKLGLPLWLGIPAVTLAPAIGLWLLGSQVLLNDFTGVPIISLSLLILNILFLAGSSRIISLRAEKLRLYTKTLSPKQGPEALDQLYRLTPVVPVWALLLFASEFGFDPFIFKLSYSVYQVILRVIVTSYFRFAQATFLWVLGYSMYSISKWGKLPVRLKPFTDDPTLGLRPYGTTSLQFVTLYIIAIFLTFPVGVYVGRPVLISQSIFFLLGLGIFLGPLLGLRKKLMQAKLEKLDWIRMRHRRVIEQVESSDDRPLDAALVVELIAIDNIRRDIQQIHNWPFNPGILARLVTVVMLPLGLAMIATYLIHMLQL